MGKFIFKQNALAYSKLQVKTLYGTFGTNSRSLLIVTETLKVNKAVYPKVFGQQHNQSSKGFGRKWYFFSALPAGRTSDHLKAFLCQSDWWDHSFTIRKQYLKDFEFAFKSLKQSCFQSLLYSRSYSTLRSILQWNSSSYSGVFDCASWWGKPHRSLTRAALFRWPSTTNSFCPFSSTYQCKFTWNH